MAQSLKGTAGARPSVYVAVPVWGCAGIEIPGTAPATPGSQLRGAPFSVPLAYSSGYSPKFHTVPVPSWASK